MATFETTTDSSGCRFQRLKEAASGYLAVRDHVPVGYTRRDVSDAQRRRLLELIDATDEDWRDWHWQLAHRLDNISILAEILEMESRQQSEIAALTEVLHWAVPPYFAALLDPVAENDPLRLQTLPSMAETSDQRGVSDPMAEQNCSPCPLVVRRYPDRLIVKVTNICAMYCRYCQRRCLAGTLERQAGRDEMEEALGYIYANPEIRDVLITGGDPLTLADETLAWLLGRLDAIPHVEIKRIGTRLPVTLPQRITGDLCQILRAHHPVYLNTQFNHPLEITLESAEACRRLADAGIVLGNQSVLLRGVNDDPFVMRRLLHELLKLRVRPYYLFQAKPVLGTYHFATTIDKGLEIMADLRGRTSGLAIPSYVVNMPGGFGKVPLLPEYIVAKTASSYFLRTWEGRTVEVTNGPPEPNTVGVDKCNTCI